MNKSEIILYQRENGKTAIEVKLEDGAVWLTQDQIAELYNRGRSTITEHIRNILGEGELEEKNTVGFSDVVHSKKPVKTYNLDMVIAVGYRVKSDRGTEFRKWATERLKEYIVQGFTINDEFLKNNGGGKYWYNLLNRIRDIRSSEKVLYRQVLDLYATSIDYNPKALESVKFFKIIQNKLHYAVSKETASEIIYGRVDSNKNFLGLTVFSGNVPTREEAHIAKNYLTEREIQDLNSLVSAFFDLAEMKARNHIPMKMSDWVRELDDFTSKYGKGTLLNAGTISNEKAINKADTEYDKYRKRLDTELSPIEQEYFKLLDMEIKQIAPKKDKLSRKETVK